MLTLIITIHIIACLFLIVLVLLQSGHEGMGVIFGGGSQSMFGSSGAGGLLVRITAILAAIFLATSLVYNVLSSSRSRQGSSLMLGGGSAATAPAEKTPAKPAVTFEEPAAPTKTPQTPNPDAQKPDVQQQNAHKPESQPPTSQKH